MGSSPVCEATAGSGHITDALHAAMGGHRPHPPGPVGGGGGGEGLPLGDLAGGGGGGGAAAATGALATGKSMEGQQLPMAAGVSASRQPCITWNNSRRHNVG